MMMPSEDRFWMIKQEISLTSFNIRELGRDRKKTKKGQKVAQAPFRPPQILLLQEHHLDTTLCRNSMANLEFKSGTALWNLGIRMEATPRTTVGTAILVNASLTTLIKEQCVSVEGQT